MRSFSKFSAYSGEIIADWTSARFDREQFGVVIKRRLAVVSGLLFFWAVFFLWITLISKGELPWAVSVPVMAVSAGVALWLLLLYIFDRVRYDESSFTVRRRTYAFSEIQAADWSRNRVCLYLEGRTVRLGRYDAGRNLLLDTACEQCDFPVNELPPKKRADIFAGHMTEDGQVRMVTAFWVITALLLLVLGIFVFESIPADRTNAVWADVTAVRMSRQKDSEQVYLYGAEEELPYRINPNELTDFDLFVRMLNEGRQCRIEYLTEDGAYDVIALKVGQTTFLTAEDWHAYHVNSFHITLSVCGGLFLLWLIFCWGVVFIGRHPRRFGAKVVYALFSEAFYKIDLSDQTTR